MKKLLLTVALLGAVAASYGQGQVNIANSGRLISLDPLDGAIVALPGTSTAGTYTFVLLAAPSATTGFVPFTGTTMAEWNATEASLAAYTPQVYGTQAATAAGRVIFTPNPATLASVAAGTPSNLVLVGWKGTGTWDDIKALTAPAVGFAIGTSPVATLTPGGGPLPIPSLFSGDAGALAAGFAINEVIVPEPTSFALLGLGAAGLLIFRRR